MSRWAAEHDVGQGPRAAGERQRGAGHGPAGAAPLHIPSRQVKYGMYIDMSAITDAYMILEFLLDNSLFKYLSLFSILSLCLVY